MRVRELDALSGLLTLLLDVTLPPRIHELPDLIEGELVSDGSDLAIALCLSVIVDDEARFSRDEANGVGNVEVERSWIPVSGEETLEDEHKVAFASGDEFELERLIGELGLESLTERDHADVAFTEVTILRVFANRVLED